MVFARTILVFIITAFLITACGGDSTPATPKDTLKAYSIAVRKKDVAMMKKLLSSETLKLHEQEAKAQSSSLDEIILRDTFFPVPEGKKFFPYRNEKIEGDKASIEIKNNFDGWDLIYLVKEEGIWKIDKKGTSDQILNQVEEDEKKLDDIINQGNETDQSDSQDDSQTDSNPTPNPDITPGSNPDLPPNDPNNPTPNPNPNEPMNPQDDLGKPSEPPMGK